MIFALLETFDNAKRYIPTYMFERQFASISSGVKTKMPLNVLQCTIVNHATKTECSRVSTLPRLIRPSLCKQEILLTWVCKDFSDWAEGE